MNSIPTLRFEPPPVYFMHVPKTAGSSLRKVLFSAYAPQQRLGADTMQLHKIDSTSLDGFRCIASHLGPGLLPFIQQRAFACVTLLRDPVEQHISSIFHRQTRLKQHPEIFQPAYLEQMQPLLKDDLRTWLDTPGTYTSGNGQTRFFGTVKALQPYFKDGKIGRKGQPLLQPVVLPNLSDNSDIEQVAARARRLLESMAVVGITERFTESVHLICDLLGIPVPTHLPRVNIGVQKRTIQNTSYRAQTPPDLIERIEAANQADLALYAYACELFEAQLARYQARPRRTISIAPRLRMPMQPIRQAAGQIKRKVLAGLKPALTREMP